MKIARLSASGTAHSINGVSEGKELSRLITAAVINQDFCNLLLADPAMAVATGYNGEPFHLALEEQELILSIRATSLVDFATQLTRNGKVNGKSHSSNGNGGRIQRSHSHNGRLEEQVCG